MSTPSVVWFKRDLRTPDHAALRAAARHRPGGEVLCLYIVEPGLWAQRDAAAQHWAFVRESLIDLDQALQAQGGQLLVMQGEATDVLQRLWEATHFAALFAHEETGNDFTYQRDLAVGQWCRSRQVAWAEAPQFGVVRRLANRNHWQSAWQAHMARPVMAIPDLRFAPLPWPNAAWPSAAELGLASETPRLRQQGGRSEALDVLQAFLTDRCGQYRGGISSPLSAPSACSRLSPYLAHGCLSMREVVQSTQARMADLADDEPLSKRQRAGLSAFLSRLHWHCHFIQKLESEPELEWRNLHRGYDGLREGEFNAAHFEALTQGRTGWPMVDACVAMLRETGWVNFRMRAMLVSVAAYPLWLHWREVGLWLARQFLDYEPGIHWSQLQMQSGTTGINTTRVYNPIKQARDHDPQGHFVRRWLPAMRKVPPQWLFEPWLMPPEVQAACGVHVGTDIPLPVVDLASATREAKARLHGLRAQPEVKAAKAAIVDKHGSRSPRGTHTGTKGRGKRPEKTTAAAEPSPQMSLGF